jgi:heterodisulfide reductase subunit A-like polyferredoxin
VEACPYGARVFDDERLIAVVKEALCQGCGVCASICPSGAAYLRGYTNDDVMAMIEQVV